MYTNEDRKERALVALQAYIDVDEGPAYADEMLTVQMQDLLTDLMHVLEPETFAICLEAAQEHYKAEIEEEN